MHLLVLPSAALSREFQPCDTCELLFPIKGRSSIGPTKLDSQLPSGDPGSTALNDAMAKLPSLLTQSYTNALFKPLRLM